MRRTLLSDMHKASACLHADCLRLWLMDTSTRAVLSDVQTEDGRPGGFLHVTEPFHATALPIDGLHFEMGLPVDSVHGEIRAESL